jgi:arsenate reductase
MITMFDTRISGTDPRLCDELRSTGLPTDDLDEPSRIFFEYRTDDGKLLGFGGYERFGDDALIRSLVVVQEERGRGIGRELLSLLLRRAFDDGARKAWLLTTSAAAFFK